MSRPDQADSGRHWLIDRILQPPFLLALLCQIAFAIWWLSGTTSEIRTYATRIGAIEDAEHRRDDRDNAIFERLARIEERVIAIQSRRSP